MSLILLKTIVSIVTILGLIFISERNPKLGGLLAGLPIGAAIMIFFYNIEQGTDFVIQGIPYGISGLVSSLVFAIGFYLGGKYFANQRIIQVIVAYSSGLLAFFIFSYILSLFAINLITSLIIFVIGAILTLYFFKHISIDKKSIPKKLTISTILFRILFVAITVLLITGFAKIIGSQWAGMMASFPTGLSPVLIILAYSYKDKLYPIVLKNFSYSVTTLLVFYLLVLWLLPLVGIYYCFLIIYPICFGYLYFLNKVILKI
jgi:hypothetical protein